MSSRIAKDYLYYLVHFYEDGSGIFDVVLNDWITYDEEAKEYWCKFHTGENREDMKLTSSLLKDFKPPPKSWQKYPVRIRGGADTYSEALKRLGALEKDPYGFTTADEENAEVQIDRLKKKLQNKRIIRDDEDIEKLFSAVKDDEACSSSASVADNDDADDDSSEHFQVNKYKSRSRASHSKHRRSRSYSPLKPTDSRHVASSSSSQGKDRAQKGPKAEGSETKKPQYHAGTTSKGSIMDISSSQENLNDERGRRRVKMFVSQKRTRTAQSEGNQQTTPRSSKFTDDTPINDITRQPVFRSHSTVDESSSRRRTSDFGSLDTIKKQLRDLALAVGQIHSQVIRVAEGNALLQQMFKDNSQNLLPGNRQPTVNLYDYFCDSVGKFEEFNGKLQTDRDFRNLVCQGIRRKLNLDKKLHLSIGEILRALIHKELLNVYVAQKKTKDKILFIELAIWKCIEEEITEEARMKELPQFKQSDLAKALGSAINNYRSSKTKTNQDGHGGDDGD